MWKGPPCRNTAAWGWMPPPHPRSESDDLRIPPCPLQMLPGRSTAEPEGGDDRVSVHVILGLAMQICRGRAEERPDRSVIVQDRLLQLCCLTNLVLDM